MNFHTEYNKHKIPEFFEGYFNYQDITQLIKGIEIKVKKLEPAFDQATYVNSGKLEDSIVDRISFTQAPKDKAYQSPVSQDESIVRSLQGFTHKLLTEVQRVNDAFLLI